jgi:hypothetical protein
MVFTGETCKKIYEISMHRNYTGSPCDWILWQPIKNISIIFVLMLISTYWGCRDGGFLSSLICYGDAQWNRPH